MKLTADGTAPAPGCLPDGSDWDTPSILNVSYTFFYLITKNVLSLIYLINLILLVIHTSSGHTLIPQNTLSAVWYILLGWASLIFGAVSLEHLINKTGGNSMRNSYIGVITFRREE